MARTRLGKADTTPALLKTVVASTVPTAVVGPAPVAELGEPVVEAKATKERRLPGRPDRAIEVVALEPALALDARVAEAVAGGRQGEAGPRHAAVPEPRVQPS